VKIRGGHEKSKKRGSCPIGLLGEVGKSAEKTILHRRATMKLIGKKRWKSTHKQKKTNIWGEFLKGGRRCIF